MKCAEIESILYSSTLNDASDMEQFQLKAHLAGCESCSKTYSEVIDLIGAIKKETHLQQLSPDGRSRLQASVAHEIAISNRRRSLVRIGSIIILSTAACLVVGVLLPKLPLSRALAFPSRPFAAGEYASPEEVWKIDSVTSFHASSAQMPVSHSGRIYTIAASGGHTGVLAVKATSGKVLWHSAIETCGFLSADRNQVYGIAASVEGHTELVALDNSTGNIRWRHSPEPNTALQGFSPAVDDGRNVCWTHDNCVEVLSKDDGKVVWQRAFEEKTVMSGVIEGSQRIIVAGGHAVYCLSNDNTTVWTRPFTRAMSSLNQPQIVSGSGFVFVSHREITGCGLLLCLRQKDGSVAWSKSNEEAGPMLCADGKLFIRSNAVKAFDITTGEMLWKMHTDGCAPLAYDQNMLYFSESAEKGILLALNAEKGTVVQRSASIGSCAEVLITDGLEIVHGISGTLYAFRQIHGATPVSNRAKCEAEQFHEQSHNPLIASLQ